MRFNRRGLGPALGVLALAAGLLGRSAAVAAQTNSQPAFATAQVAETFLAGVAASALLPAAPGGAGGLAYAFAPTPPLPAGLSFDAAARNLYGVAQRAPAAATYRLAATDADGETATREEIVTVDARPSFGGGAGPALTFTVGRAQTAALPAARGGAGTLIYALDPTAPLPRGLAFDATARTVTAAATAAAQAAATYRLVATDTAAATATLEFTIAIGNDYDADDDGLIEIGTLAQLDAVRYDVGGEGVPSTAAYRTAFPHAAPRMGCPDSPCRGYELVADLDFDQNDDGRITAADAAYWNNGAGWDPIRAVSSEGHITPFHCTFQGNGHAISHLYVHRPTGPGGLFGRVAKGGRVEGLTLRNVQIWGNGAGSVALSNFGTITDVAVSGSVTAHRGHAGGLVSDNNGQITTSSSSATVSGSSNVGGLAGRNIVIGSIVASYATGTVTGSGGAVGGLVGSNTGLITASHATGAVTGRGNEVGGLVGSNKWNRDAVIRASYATGAVTARGDEVGGLAGNNVGRIIGSFARGAVTGRSDTHVGGLVGHNAGTITASYATGAVTTSGSQAGGLVGANAAAGRIAASYATGAVTASSAQAVGGLVGDNQGAVTASYATGDVAGDARVGGLVGDNQGQGAVTASYARGVVSGRAQVGGLVGAATATSAITASYWDTTASGQTASRGGTGQTAQALQAPTAYAGLYAAWNVNLDGRAGADAPWDFGAASQYPVLQYGRLCSADQRTD